MENKKEMTAPNVSVGADTEQPIQKIAENSIYEYEENIKSFEEMQREMLLSSNRWQLPFRFIFLLKKSFFWLLISSHVKQAFPFSLYLSIQSNHMPYCRILISLSVFLWRLR